MDNQYWNERYLEGNIPWDAGVPTPPIKAYMEQLEDKGMRILVPGAGNAYEAEYLHKKGFTNVYVCDWAEKAIQLFRERVPDFPPDHTIVSDFFRLEPAYELVLEQTFFCALPPSMRRDYASKVSELLTTNGKLAGLLFKELPIPQGPPFGGNKAEYLDLFGQYFHELKIEDCYNSINPRMGNELFISITGKKNKVD